MNVTIKEFIKSNVNLGVIWNIDNGLYKGNFPAIECPDYLLEKNVDFWRIIQTKGTIIIYTK